MVKLFMNKLYFTKTKIIYGSTQKNTHFFGRNIFKTIFFLPLMIFFVWDSHNKKRTFLNNAVNKYLINDSIDFLG